MLDNQIIPIRKLDRSRDHEFHFKPDDVQNAEILSHSGWRALKGIELKGKLTPHDDGWSLEGDLSGTVTLSCVISDAPIHQRLSTKIRRFYWSKGMELPSELSWDLDFDVDQEEMPQNLDLLTVISEAIALEVPDYPKLPKFQSQSDGSPWQYLEDEPVEVETQRPFANLKDLIDSKNTK